MKKTATKGFVYLDEDGKVIPRPDPLPKDATTEEWITWMRQMAAYNDRVTDVANKAFHDAFMKAMKQ